MNLLGMGIAWVALFAYDTSIFALTLLKSYRDGDGITAMLSTTWTSNSLISLVVRDGRFSSLLLPFTHVVNGSS
jgi:hypothetical protein